MPPYDIIVMIRYFVISSRFSCAQILTFYRKALTEFEIPTHKTKASTTNDQRPTTRSQHVTTIQLQTHHTTGTTPLAPTDITPITMNAIARGSRAASTKNIAKNSRSVFSSIFNSSSDKKQDQQAKINAIPANMSTDSKVESLSRSQIADMIAEEHDLTNAKAERIVKGVFDTIAEVSFNYVLQQRHRYLEEKLQRASFHLIYSHFPNSIQNVTKNKKVRIAGFGTFSNIHVNARQGRNPQNGERIMIAAKQRVKFAPFKALKDAINE